MVLGVGFLPAVPLPGRAPSDILGRGRQLRAHKRRIVVGELNAPAGDVSAQERDIPAFVQETADRLTNLVAPILVVPNRKQQLAPVQPLGVAMHVQIAAISDAVARAFKPRDERRVPVREALTP
jgi:hypothetical protein